MSSPALAVTPAVTAEERAQILAVDAAASRADGISALDDQVRLDLEYGDPTSTRHIVARLDDAAVAGYAHVDLSSTDVATGHVVVDPGQREHGLGHLLVQTMQAEAASASLRIWAHGDGSAARSLADRLGFRRVRDLWRMVKPLNSELPEPNYPADVTVRAFVPGQDEAAWVTVNAAAFAMHPEQGQLTVDDLMQRMAQDWFDPTGFFLAERAGVLVGFHWTKVHGASPDQPEPIGEVHVVGVDPPEQGLGLGKGLTLTGLHHLKSRGLPAVMLYVDADNHPAVAVYERLGFERAAVDVMYER